MPVILDPDAALVYQAFQDAGRPAYETLTPVEAREYYRQARLVTNPEPPLLKSVEPLAIAAPGSKVDTVNYGTLEKLIHNAAHAALKAGIAPRQIVGVFVRDTILHTAMILGLMRMGVTTVSLRSPRVPDGIVTDAILTVMPREFAETTTVIAVDYEALGEDWL